MDPHVRLLAAATDGFERLVAELAALPETAWQAPTPCDIPVREVVDHVVAGNLFAVLLLGGASAAEATAGLDDDHLGSDPVPAVRGSGRSQVDAFAGADRGRPLHHPSGDISWETFLRFRLGDVVVHGWDVAVGAGLPTDPDPDVVAGLWTLVEPHRDQMRRLGAFGTGASTDLPPDAPLLHRLLDAYGRRPR